MWVKAPRRGAPGVPCCPLGLLSVQMACGLDPKKETLLLPAALSAGHQDLEVPRTAWTIRDHPGPQGNRAYPARDEKGGQEGVQDSALPSS